MAVWRQGRLAVGLWGGWRDQAGTLPRMAATLVSMMSVLKGVTATLVHVPADWGPLGLDRPAAHYWPALTAGGETGVLVRHAVVSNNSNGVCGSLFARDQCR